MPRAFSFALREKEAFSVLGGRGKEKEERKLCKGCFTSTWRIFTHFFQEYFYIVAI